MTDKDDLKAKLEGEHRRDASRAEDFARAVVEQLSALLKKEGIALGNFIEFRVKSPESILEKQERNDLHIDSIHDLHDFIGVRVMPLFLRDVARISKVIEETFDITEQEDTAERLGDDRFGYTSLHYILSLKDKWLEVPTFAEFKGLRAELQLRTLAQHIWAASSHALQYKQEAAVPPQVRRAINRVSALLELVDLEFERALTERDAYREGLAEQPQIDGNAILDVDSLETILDEMLPLENKSDAEPYSRLLSELRNHNVATVGGLRDILERHWKAIQDKESYYVAKNSAILASGQENVTGTALERARRGVYFTHTGLTRQAVSAEFGSDLVGLRLDFANAQIRPKNPGI